MPRDREHAGPLALALLLGSCALVSCSSCSKRATADSTEGGAGAADSGPFAHPCQLLQRGDVEPVLGTADLRPTEEPAGHPGDARCLWAVSNARGFAELRIHVPTRKDELLRPSAERRPVPNLGDKAYALSRNTWGHVDVLKGDQTFYVQVQRPGGPGSHDESPDKAQQDAVALARVVAARL
jgi:hypothetical protein